MRSGWRDARAITSSWLCKVASLTLINSTAQLLWVSNSEYNIWIQSGWITRGAWRGEPSSRRASIATSKLGSVHGKKICPTINVNSPAKRNEKWTETQTNPRNIANEPIPPRTAPVSRKCLPMNRADERLTTRTWTFLHVHETLVTNPKPSIRRKVAKKRVPPVVRLWPLERLDSVYKVLEDSQKEWEPKQTRRLGLYHTIEEANIRVMSLARRLCRVEFILR